MKPDKIDQFFISVVAGAMTVNLTCVIALICLGLGYNFPHPGLWVLIAPLIVSAMTFNKIGKMM